MAVIGVIGDRVLDNPDRLAAGVDEALDRIDTHFGGGPLVVMASLAEGADRLVVRRAFERLRVSTLVVPLPFLQPEFENDFREPGSLEEFRSLLARARYVLPLPPPHGTPRSEAYALAGRFILERAHVLLAVGDGTPSRNLIAIARDAGIPVVWVHAGNESGASSGSTVRPPGTVTFEGL